MTLDQWLVIVAIGLSFFNVLVRWPRATLIVCLGLFVGALWIPATLGPPSLTRTSLG